METETRTTATILAGAAAIAIAAVGVILAPAGAQTETPAACAQAVQLGYDMNALHGQVAAHQAAYSIALDYGMDQRAQDIQAKLFTSVEDYQATAAEYDAAAKRCR